jgi:HEAT repeats/HEAT repeat
MDNKCLNVLINAIEYLWYPLIYPVFNILQWLLDSIIKLFDIIQSCTFVGTYNSRITHLIHILIKDDSNKLDRIDAANILSKMGGSSRAIPQLLPLLKDRNPDIRYSVIKALKDIGKLPSSELPELYPLLQDSNSEVRMMAIHILGYRRDSASKTIPYLVPLLKESDLSVRLHVHMALGKLGYDKTTKSS